MLKEGVIMKIQDLIEKNNIEIMRYVMNKGQSYTPDTREIILNNSIRALMVYIHELGKGREIDETEAVFAYEVRLGIQYMITHSESKRKKVFNYKKEDALQFFKLAKKFNKIYMWIFNGLSKTIKTTFKK